MEGRCRKRAGAFLAFFLALAPCSIWAAGKYVSEPLQTTSGKYDLGFVLNAQNLLLDIESYEGGIGVKISKGKLVFRGAADLLINTDFNPFSITLGAALEKHFLPGPISPYWGVFAELGFTRLRTEIDADNWSQQLTYPLTFGALLGIEIFVFNFLSLFVEFGLPVMLGIDATDESVAGSVTHSSKFLYNVDLGLANQSMIGVVIYIMRRKS
jgi:hypothetical protein